MEEFEHKIVTNNSRLRRKPLLILRMETSNKK